MALAKNGRDPNRDRNAASPPIRRRHWPVESNPSRIQHISGSGETQDMNELHKKWFKYCRSEIPLGRAIQFGRDRLTHYYSSRGPK